MWLSKNINTTPQEEKAQNGSVTISSADNIEAGSTVTSRNTDMYMPYGYTALPPVGEEVLIIPAGRGQAIMGTLAKFTALASGEIQLRSQGDAIITLRNDGSVVINSLIIDKDGVIKQ